MLLFNSVSCRLKLTSIREMLSHSELYIKSNRLEESVLCVLCVTFKLVIALLSPVYLGSLKKKNLHVCVDLGQNLWEEI